MAASFESSHDLDAAISEFSDELNVIAGHFIAIADAWKAAGEALSSEIELSQTIPNSNLIIVIGGGACVLIIGVILVIRRRRIVQKNHFK
jgi:hypothetical protein